MNDRDLADTGLVVIGRNEGERLARCLASVRGVGKRVYVDSGSTDGSVALARAEGLTTVELSEPPQFTAARARNAGLVQLLVDDTQVQFVQMVDGDCEVQPGWIAAAVAAMRGESRLAAVTGRQRERYPERSIYNAVIDDEWQLPVGEVSMMTGTAVFRVAALQQVNLFNPTMIAGEDTELLMRLHKRGWQVRRIDADMVIHDADMTRFHQWWKRTRRSGHAFGEMAFLHPDARNPNWPRTVRSIQFWGGVTPAMLVVGSFLAVAVDRRFWIAPILILLGWALNIARLIWRQFQRGLGVRVASASGTLLMVGKLPQFAGLFRYHWNRLWGRASQLIEYKGPKSA